MRQLVDVTFSEEFGRVREQFVRVRVFVKFKGGVRQLVDVTFYENLR